MKVKVFLSITLDEDDYPITVDGFVDEEIDPKKREGYIVGRTDTFEIDPEGNLILKDKFDFGSGEYDGFGWKRRDKKNLAGGKALWQAQKITTDT